MSYDYMVRMKRISLPKEELKEDLVTNARKEFAAIHFIVKGSLKRTQVLMEVKRGIGPVRARELLNQATIFLREF